MSENGRQSLTKNSIVGVFLGGIKVCVQLVSLPIIANFLGPNEFAVYALAFPAVSFFLVLADAGVNGTLAREDEGNKQIWSAAFWAIFSLCLILQMLIILLGYVLAATSSEWRLKELMFLLSFCLPFMGLTNIPAARLYRRGRIQFLSSSDALAAFVGAAAGVFCAYSGWGATSLAIQLLVAFAVRMTLVNMAAFEIPAFTLRFSEIGSHAVVGITIVLSRLSEFGGRTVENIVFQSTLGSASLGIYNLGNQICRFACDAIGNPVWASLYAHALHTERKDLSLLLARTISAVGYIILPIASMLVVAADPLFSAVMSPRWQPAAGVVSILIVFYGMNSVLGLTGAVLTALGSPRAILYATASFYILRIVSVSLGGLLGFHYTVFLVGIASFSYVGVLVIGAREAFGFRAGHIIKPLCKSLLSCTLMIAFYFLTSFLLPSTLPFLLLKIAASVMFYVFCLFMLKVEELSVAFSKLKALI